MATLALSVPRVGAQSSDNAASLAALVREARSSHPAVQRARHADRAAAEVPSQVGSLPDPVAMFGLSNMRIDEPGLDTSPMTGLVFGLQQAIPFPGKLARREETAAAGREVATSSIEVIRAAVELEVRRSYWILYLAERQTAITQDNVKVMDALTNAVTARFSVGQGAQQDALQAQVAHSRLRSMLEMQQQQLASARRTLNAAAGREPSAPVGVTSPPPSPPPLDRQALLREALANNPRLAVARKRAGASRVALDQASYERYPDFAVGLSYRLRQAAPGDMSRGADMVGATLAVSLPIWAATKQNAQVRQQAAQLDAASAEVHDLELEIEEAIGRALDRFDRLGRQIELHRTELLPQSDQALDASIEDYNFGRVGFVSVMRNWRDALDVQLEMERLLTERAQVIAMTDALAGRTLEEKVK